MGKIRIGDKVNYRNTEHEMWSLDRWLVVDTFPDKSVRIESGAGARIYISANKVDTHLRRVIVGKVRG